MDKHGKIALIALISVASLIGGFFLTGAIRNNKDSAQVVVYGGHPSGSNSDGTSSSVGTNTDIHIIRNDNQGTAENGKTTEVVSNVTPNITSVSKPIYNTNSKKYTFNVTAEGNGLTFILTSANGTTLLTQESGLFTVDPIWNGVYMVYVTNASGTKSNTETVSGCVIVYEKLTASQIQTAFNSGDYMTGDELDFPNRISPSCTYSFTNLQEGEDKPMSYGEIFNRIQLSSWRSISVNSVSHDQASNQVIHINMTINY